MMQFCWRVVGALCVMFLCACGAVDERSAREEATGARETSVERAMATKVAETNTPQASLRPPATKVAETRAPQASLRPPATLVAATLPPAPSIEKEPLEMLPTVNVPPALQALVDQALNDLAERLDVGVEKIDVIDLKSVVWPDGALGCPQPGMAYIQVLQEGLLIRLRVGKRIYSYHSGGKRAPFLCENPSMVDEGLAPPPGLGNE